jgi:stage IV sporulation protein FB
MDGGRILRAGLSGKIGFKQATAGMAGLGKIIAAAIFGYGGYQAYLAQYQGINLIIASSLLFWAARREGQLLAYAFMRYLVNKRTDLTRHGALPCLQIVSRADTRLKTILDMARPNVYLMVIMIDENDRPLGMRSEAEIIEAYLNGGPGMLLRDC